ncbi:MAG: hypothetical protein ACI9PP_002289 [Halobacteriales archaeon]|jgi:hypothetical protein
MSPEKDPPGSQDALADWAEEYDEITGAAI